MNNANLTERDKAILRHVYDFTRLLPAQIQGLVAFPSLKKAQRRLTCLVKKGLLVRERLGNPGSGSRPFIYAIGKKGVGVVSEGRAFKPSHNKLRSRNDSTMLEHLIRVNDFIVNLITSCKGSQYACSYIPEYVGKEGIGKPDRYVSMKVPHPLHRDRELAFIPDIVVCLEREGRKALFFVEIDLGTEPLEASYGSRRDFYLKLMAYSVCSRDRCFERWSREFSYDFSGFRLLVVTSSEERLANISKIVARDDVGIDDMVLLSTVEKLENNSVLGGVWRMPGDANGKMHSIVKG